MTFIDLFRKEASTTLLRPLLVVGTITGACNTGVLIVMNMVSSQTAETSDPDAVSTIDYKLFFLFVVIIIGFILTKRFTLYTASKLAENIIGKIRIRLVNKVRFSEFAVVEELDQGSLYSRIVQQTQVVSQNAPMIMEMVQSGVMLVFCMMYVIYLSIPAFIIVTVTTVIAVWMYSKRRKVLEELARQSDEKELEIFESLDMVLRGFKEIKLRQKKSNAVFSDYRRSASSLRDLRLRLQLQFAENVIFAQIFYYILIGIVLFGLPMLVGSMSEDISKITAAVLFFIGPLGSLVGAFPAMVNVNQAVGNLYQLEDHLDSELAEETKSYINDFDASETVEFEPIKFEKEIVFSNILFSYRNEKGGAFTLGPIEKFTIKKGELMFIEGGNGSGKSTLVKILTGLYYPNQGARIEVDGKIIEKGELQNYRELFAAIFTDFHLARKLYGLKKIDKKRADDLLALMQISDKTQIVDDSFTDIDLSTGQRKRLALLVTYLEDKDIYVFDEVAADQDPQFREYFYKDLLPELQSNGKTIIVISHDDRYFSCAERKFKMYYGKVVSEVHYKDGEVVSTINYNGFKG